MKSYCGFCNTVIPRANDQWEEMSIYPMISGGEITGKLSEVGARVAHYKVGDKVAVSCFVRSDASASNMASGGNRRERR
jgi:alcohol dehydrogenase (NADP+)